MKVNHAAKINKNAGTCPALKMAKVN